MRLVGIETALTDVVIVRRSLVGRTIAEAVDITEKLRFMFRDITKYKSALRETQVPSPSMTLMITEKEYNSPDFQTTSQELAQWLAGWNNANASKNYANSGLERHGVLPIATAADGHSQRFTVPNLGFTGGANPTFYPGLGDCRSDTSASVLWVASKPALYMREVATSDGF